MDTAEQMRMAFMFEEGGIADDGMSVDPVSGNEIPPGSLAKEVRDDVPAQLSEGEYVVPADVVRYYGVKFFEDLRSEAKNGMMEMEANGRIGGEPVAMTMENQTGGELTPDELAAIQSATGMAIGGMVSTQQQQMPYSDPYTQQQTMYNQYNQGGSVLYAADGVDVDPGIKPYEAQFGAIQGSMFAPGFLIDQVKGRQQVRTVTLYGPNGEVETITLPGQEVRMQELLDAGYSAEPVKVTTGAPTVTKEETGGESSPMPTVTPTPVDYSKMSDEQLINSAKAFNLLGTMGTVLAGTMNLPIASVVNVGIANRYNNLIDTMASRGIDVSDMKRKGSIFGGEGTLTENLEDISGDEKISFADTWLGDFLGFDGSMGIEKGNPGLIDSFNGARRTSGTTKTSAPAQVKKDSGTTPVSNNKGSSNKNVGDDSPLLTPVRGLTTEEKKIIADKGPATTTPGKVTSAVSPGITASDIEKNRQAGADLGYTKGGMVERRSKKK